MSAYFIPIQTAIIIFLIASFILVIPWCVFSYRKYRFISWSKSLVIFSFIFYSLTALFLVLLPLPEVRNTCALQPPNTIFYNFTPFQFISDILYRTPITWSSPSTWKYIFIQPSFFQAFFNFLLLLPLGVYLRYFLQKRKYVWKAFLIGLGVTLFFEITQVTGIYGIYNCPYRIFDVDDLMLNSIGAVVGFLIAPVILYILPTHQEVMQESAEIEANNIVTPGALFIALLVDLILANVVASIVPINSLVVYVLSMFLFIVIVPISWQGQTVGSKLLRFRYVAEQGHPFQKAMLRRFISIAAYYVFFAVIKVANNIELNIDSSWYVFAVFTVLATFMLALLVYAIVVIHVIRVLLGKGKRRYYFDQIGRIYASRH